MSSTTDLGIKNFFRIQRFTLAGLGANISRNGGRFTRPLLLWGTYFALFALMFPMVVYSARHQREIVEISDAMTPFMQAWLSLWKVTLFVYRQREMVELIERVWHLTAQASGAERVYIAQENSQDAAICTLYYMSVGITGLMALVVPLLRSTLIYLLTDEFGFIAPLKGVYPFEHNNSLNYCLLYVWSAAGIWSVVHGSVSVDAVFSWFIHNTAAQFRIIQLKLAAIEALPDAVERSTALRACFQHHQRVIDIASKVDTLYQPVVFVEFSVNVIEICFLAYQIGSGAVVLANLPFLFLFIISVGIQLMIYCYCGQKLQNESETVALSMYGIINEPIWPLKLRKELLFCLMRSQKSCKLTGYFFVADLSLFLQVWRSAASYVTLLRSVDQKVPMSD